MRKLEAYRTNATNALLMATVDAAITRRVMGEVTAQFYDPNASLLAINRMIDDHLDRELAAHDAAMHRQVTIFAVLLLAASLATLLIGYGLSRLLSRDLRELTDAQRRAEQPRDAALLAAEHAHEAKNDFLATMSHELRTPLNAIIGFSEMIRSAAFGPIENKYREYAHDIGTDGSHLLDLVTDVLDIARIEARALDLNREAVDIPDAGVTLAVHIPDGLEKFGQVRAGHLEAHKGAGIGLAIVNSLVALLEGKLSIESEVGTGTAVTIAFPKHRTVMPPGRDASTC